jgi:hypothetical protein
VSYGLIDVTFRSADSFQNLIGDSAITVRERKIGKRSSKPTSCARIDEEVRNRRLQTFPITLGYETCTSVIQVPGSSTLILTLSKLWNEDGGATSQNNIAESVVSTPTNEQISTAKILLKIC